MNKLFIHTQQAGLTDIKNQSPTVQKDKNIWFYYAVLIKREINVTNKMGLPCKIVLHLNFFSQMGALTIVSGS